MTINKATSLIREERFNDVSMNFWTACLLLFICSAGIQGQITFSLQEAQGTTRIFSPPPQETAKRFVNLLSTLMGEYATLG